MVKEDNNNDSQEGIYFEGFHNKKFDNKGRVSLPPEFLSENFCSGSRVSLIAQKDKWDMPYIFAIPRSRLEEKLQNKNISIEDISPILKTVNIDSQKRILLNNLYLTHINADHKISNELWLFGYRNYFSIYSYNDGLEVINYLQKIFSKSNYFK